MRAGQLTVRAQAVSGHLTKASHAQNANKTTTGVVGVPKLMVIPPLLVGSLQTDLTDHLLELELYNRMVRVTLAVELSEDCGSLFDLVVGYKPPGRLGDEEHADNDDARGHHLQPDGDPPAILALDVRAAVDSP